jgi:DNA-binding SARP family transcriptional activator
MLGTWGVPMQAHCDIRIRLLGELQVLRPDGTVVAADEWRTGKTMDLLRLLALSNGRPVRPESLTEKLWPNASPDRARASLRTACSHIRRAVQTNCVVRQLQGLVLQGAWVDAAEFLDHARRVQAAAHDAEHTQVLALVDSAEQLYRGAFQAFDDDSDWARTEQDHLERTRHKMLCAAAAAALELRLFGEALDFANCAARSDLTSETAHRHLMSAHAGLGEVGGALRVFESYRAHLAEELGADPSPQTSELRLQLLHGTAADPVRALPRSGRSVQQRVL